MAKDVYIRPTSISFLRICQSPATDVVVVACLRGVFFVSSLIAACSLGLCSLRKQFFCASRGFVQMARNSAVMFPDATQAGTSCTFECFRDDGDRGESWFRLVESEGDGNDGGDWLVEETGDGGAWWEKIDHTACRIAVNEDLDVPTHGERPSSSRDRRYEYTSIVASETLRVSFQENFKAGALRQNVGKITIGRFCKTNFGTIFGKVLVSFRPVR